MSTLTARPPLACPNWCATDHTLDEATTDPQAWITHHSERNARSSWTVRINDGGEEPLVMYLTMSNLSDGTVVEDGLMFGSRLIEAAKAEEFLQTFLAKAEAAEA